ncbi:DUF1963 domain-containing protein [Kytococcus sedentarius]|uniref:DUF1963 domain-containing protein n=1 Tax=Kytococcus sedentarius TaxID=1276 RepID=UPI0035BBADEA
MIIHDVAALEAVLARQLDPTQVQLARTLLRPGIHLVAAGPGDAVVGQLGGTTFLPAGVQRPAWEGHGTLSLVLELDLGAIAATGLDAGRPLPRSGRLQAWYVDAEEHDDPDAVVGSWDDATRDGARLLLVPPAAETDAPTGGPALDGVALTARAAVCWPSPEQPQLLQALGVDDPMGVWDHPLFAEPLMQELEDLAPEQPKHLVGGWPDLVQGPVEYEVSQWGQPDDHSPSDAEMAAWTPLLQVDSDDSVDLMWGDCGVLYWLTRGTGDDLAGQAEFTWQCS